MLKEPYNRREGRCLSRESFERSLFCDFDKGAEGRKEFIIWIVTASNKVSKIIERRATKSEIAVNESKQRLVDVVWMKEARKFRRRRLE